MNYLSLNRSEVVINLDAVDVALKGKANLDYTLIMMLRSRQPLQINYANEMDRRDADFELLTKRLKTKEN